MACKLSFKLSGVSYSIDVDESMEEKFHGAKTLSDVLELLSSTERASLFNDILKFTNVQNYEYDEKPTVAMLAESEDAPNIKIDRLTQVLEDMHLPEGNHSKLRALVLKLLKDQGNNNKISLVNKKITDGSREGNGVYIDKTMSVYLYAEPNENVEELEDLFASSQGEVLLERLAHELIHRIYDRNVSEYPERATGMVNNFNSRKKELSKDYKSIVGAISKLKTDIDKAKELVAYSFSNFGFLKALDDKILNLGFQNKYSTTINLSDVADVSSSTSPHESSEVPFTGDTDEALQKEMAVVNPGTEDYQVERAKQVLNRFIQNTSELQKNAEFKYTKFDVSYGEPIELDDYNSDIQVLRLAENDLVRISKDVKWDKVKGAWVETEGEGKSSYRPIIKTYIGKDNEVMITLPIKDGSGRTYSMPAKFVSHLRKYEGDLTDVEVNENKVAEYAQWMVDNVNSAYDNESSKQSVIRTFTLEGSNGKKDFTISVPSNYESYGFQFSNPDAAADLYRGLVVGDVVKVAIPAKGNSKAGGFRGKVIRKFGNSLEVVTHNGKTVIVKPKDLREIIYLKENHEDFLDMVQKSETTLGQRVLSQELLEDNKSKFRKYNRVNFISQTKVGNSYTDKVNSYYDIYSDSLSDEDYAANKEKRRKETSKLKPGDLIKIKWMDFNKSGWYPVVAKTSDKVYFYNTASGKVSSVNIMGSQNAEVYGLAFSNVESSKLYEEFSDMRESFEGLWDGNVKENLSEALKNGEATSLQDAYYITEIEDIDEVEDGEDNDLKLAVSQVERGSIVKAHTFDFTKDGEVTKTKVYKWFVITGFDENTGRPIGITVTKDRNKPTGIYKEYPLEFSEIKAIGQRLSDNPDLGVYGNRTLSQYLDKLRATYNIINEPIFVADTKEAKAPHVKMGRTFAETSYGLVKGNKLGYAFSDKYLEQAFANKEEFKAYQKEHPEIAHLIWAYEGPKLAVYRKKQYMKRLYTNYLEVHDLLNYEPDIHNNIQIGDIVTETYENKYGDKKTIDGMVTKVSPTGLWVEQSTKTPSAEGVNVRTKKIYRRPTGVEYPNISSVYIHKKNDVTSTSTVTAKERQAILQEGSKFAEKKKTSLKDSLTKKVKKSMQTDGFFKTRDSETKILEVMDRLNTIYGVEMIPLRTEEIAKNFADILGDNVSRTRGFIYDGKVYINLDLASTAEPMHEMGHLVLESIKKSDFALYQSIISAVQSHPYYDSISASYPGRTAADMDEEVFVTVFAEKYRSTEKSKYNKGWYDENESIFSNVLSFIKNMFATTFQNDSILNLSNEEIISMNLDELISKFGDNLMEGKFTHVLNFNAATVERKVVNLKTNLLENGNESEIYLRKICSI